MYVCMLTMHFQLRMTLSSSCGTFGDEIMNTCHK